MPTISCENLVRVQDGYYTKLLLVARMRTSEVGKYHSEIFFLLLLITTRSQGNILISSLKLGKLKKKQQRPSLYNRDQIMEDLTLHEYLQFSELPYIPS